MKKNLSKGKMNEESPMSLGTFFKWREYPFTGIKGRYTPSGFKRETEEIPAETTKMSPSNSKPLFRTTLVISWSFLMKL